MRSHSNSPSSTLPNCAGATPGAPGCNGTPGQLIKTRFVFHLVRVIARKHAALLDDKRLARDVTQAAIERMARNDPRHDTRDDAWDRDQETISTPEER
jgi:hypothetical protein